MKEKKSQNECISELLIETVELLSLNETGKYDNEIGITILGCNYIGITGSKNDDNLEKIKKLIPVLESNIKHTLNEIKKDKEFLEDWGTSISIFNKFTSKAEHIKISIDSNNICFRITYNNFYTQKDSEKFFGAHSLVIDIEVDAETLKIKDCKWSLEG